MKRVSFLGPGIMGAPMVQALSDAKVQVTLWARRRDSAVALVDDFISAASSLEEAVSASDIVLGCLLDDAAVRSVYLKDGGVVSNARPGQVFVEHGTFSPDTAREVNARLQLRGAVLIDAPVTGGPSGARAGSLAIMIGGDESGIAAARPYLECYSKLIARIGDSGAGLQLKLVNQLLVSVHLVAAAEAAATLSSANINLTTAANVLREGWAQSAMLDRSLQILNSGEPTGKGATIGGLIEVQRVVSHLLRELGVVPRVFPAATTAFRDAVARGFAEDDPAALIRLWG